MERIELLAPAKDKQTAITAINYGADAVYMGAPEFGARKAVPNSIEDIKEVVDYAHKFFAKVHVTINTILTDDELDKAQKIITELYKIGVDAIIVQDMGILQLAIEGKLPPIPIHISTQCDNRDLDKVKFFDEIGVSRVILARETSLEDIKKICSNVNCEIETFVHGALCVSYSGQCYLSYAIGGRSANRGECAQPCRKKYTLIDDSGKIIAKDKYLLSLKDFNASKHLEELVRAGVKSFKIEGRLKDINYVKNVVAYYRKELDKIALKTSSGRVDCDFEPDLNKSFNRGYTDYFLEQRKKCFNFATPKSLGEKIGKVTGVGQKYFTCDGVKLSAQDGICWLDNGEIMGCLVNSVDGNKIFPNKPTKPKLGTIIYRNQDVKFEKQLQNSSTKRQIGVGFVYKDNNLIVTDEDGVTTEIEIKSSELAKNPDKMRENFETQLNKTGNSDFYVKYIKIEGEIPFLPVSKINELRRQILENLMAERIKQYKNEIQGELKYSNYPKSEVDYRENIHNSKSEEFYENCGTKIKEKSLENSGKCSGKCLMQTKHCLKFALDMCKSPRKLTLIDEKGKKYPLEFDCKNCMMKILNI